MTVTACDVYSISFRDENDTITEVLNFLRNQRLTECSTYLFREPFCASIYNRHST
jgi:hypothetical protein